MTLFIKTMTNNMHKLLESDLLGKSEEVEGFHLMDNGDMYKGNWVKDT